MFKSGLLPEEKLILKNDKSKKDEVTLKSLRRKYSL